MKICILSDSHDNRQTLTQAAKIAKDRGAECVLHCGDVVAPSTLNVLVRHQLPTHVIYGNNTGDITALANMASSSKNQLQFYGQDADITLAGVRIFMVHYPHYAEAMALTGKYDLVCCGHSHYATIQQVQNIKGQTTTIVNPGNTAGIGQAPHMVMGDLGTMEFELIKLES
jgi:uncharacterized protein